LKRDEEGNTVLPDGSAFFTASLPLPGDHWIYEKVGEPPMPWQVGTQYPEARKRLKEQIYDAGKYAIKAATMRGKEMDFDPDALLQNLVIGMIGYNTADGCVADNELAVGAEDWEGDCRRAWRQAQEVRTKLRDARDTLKAEQTVRRETARKLGVARKQLEMAEGLINELAAKCFGPETVHEGEAWEPSPNELERKARNEDGWKPTDKK